MRTALVWTFVLGLSSGCVVDAPEPKESAAETGTSDDEEDGDGYSPSDGDCNDTDATVFPGAEERCDGIDNDCDGEIDVGLRVPFYQDADGDGFGGDTTIDACETPEGYAAVGGDCDDADDAVFPGAPELCNQADDDCDGSADEDLGEPRWADGDADGYGDPGAEVSACGDTPGLVDNADDCDDTDADASPVGVEVCDEADNDCDGVVDDGVTTTWYQDVDADGYGDTSGPEEACSLPTGYAATADDCDDADPTIHPAAAEVCDGVDQDCDGSVDDGATDMSAWYGDGDGDGHGAGTAVAACEAPAGHVSSADDCDDGDPAVSPSADEVCNGVDDDCDGDVDEASAVDAPTWYGDADADGYGAAAFTAVACSAPSGYVATADDCDDLEAAVHPGAAETCDGVDEDCDGTVDDSPTDPADFYADGDGDGYGDAGTAVSDCSAPVGYVADATDCDDADLAVHPGATETCDGADEDCDGVPDDGVATSDWYDDADSDGYGDAAVATTACAAPSGSVADATDCDDADGAIHPGATETCDGVDEDCDGVVDDGVATTTWYADADSDGFGDAASTAAACAVPAGYVAVDTDCDDGDAAIHPGATETCDGVDEDCDGVVDDGVATTTWYEDADGDGYGDASSTYATCGTPAGYVLDDTDCDDDDALLFPESSGVCPDGLDCRDILDNGKSVGSGTYTIDPDGSGGGVDPFDVLCEMDLHGGGWTQAIQEYLDALSTSTSRNYLYSYGSNWYVSPSTTYVWNWSSYQALNGTYGYGTGATLTSTFSCTHAESGHWGVGCSNGGGGTYKVLPIYTSSPSAATSTICQDRPDVFGVGACRGGASIWARE